jgi:predicted Abi (CAAX) family protease
MGKFRLHEIRFGVSVYHILVSVLFVHHQFTLFTLPLFFTLEWQALLALSCSSVSWTSMVLWLGLMWCLLCRTLTQMPGDDDYPPAKPWQCGMAAGA